MNRRLAKWLAWSLWTLTFTILVLEVPSVNVSDQPIAINLFGSLVLLAYATAGALIASRQPRNTIGWLLLGSAMLSTLGDLGIEYGVYGLVTRPGVLPAAAWVADIGGSLRTLGFFTTVTFLLLLFPTGRLPSPRWRPLAALSLFAIVFFSAVNLLTADLSNEDLRLTTAHNPLGIFPSSSIEGGILSGLGFLLILSCIIGCCVSVVVRFRRARGVERQQLKWLVYAALWATFFFFGAIVGVFTNNTVLASAATFELSMLGLPVAVGVAILRHRLFDIDIIINRTLVYGSLTVLLAAVYFGCVIGLQHIAAALAGPQAGGNPLIIVLSTLLIAALFTPLRRRIQRFIDHRFYRAKYDSARTLERFAATLRSEVELNALRDHLVAVVDETMRPAHVSVWLLAPQRERLPSSGTLDSIDRERA